MQMEAQISGKVADVHGPVNDGKLEVKDASGAAVASTQVSDGRYQISVPASASYPILLVATPSSGISTDPVKAVATGECKVALSNSYYVARMMRSTKPEDREAMEKVGVVFPDQAGRGTHVNIAGGAVARYAPHADAAQKFLEYLASASAQNYFANGNNEYPVVDGLATDNPALKALGTFKAEVVPVGVVGANSAKVQQMLDRVGFK